MTKFNIFTTLNNRAAVLSTVWSILQQMIVAASTYFIVTAIRETTAGHIEQGFHYIIAFVASLILVYIPNTISMLYLQRWRLNSIHQFIQAFILNNKGRTSFGHVQNKEKLESWLTNESFNVYDNVTNLIYQLLSTLLNAIMNIIVIAIALDSKIFIAYFYAGLILLFSNYFFKSKISEVAVSLQRDRKELSNKMLSAWENIFIGNNYNFMLWHQSLKKQFTKTEKTTTDYDLLRSIISSGTVVIALIIIAFGNWKILQNNMTNIPLISALFISLPRQLQIIQSIFAYFNLVLSWQGAIGQLKELESVVMQHLNQTCLHKYIQWDKIQLSDGHQNLFYTNIDTMMNSIKKSKPTRWTLRGPNGSGKSTLLSFLKEKLGDESYLLPTDYSSLIFSESFLKHSDGNRLLSIFNEIRNIENVEYFLFDEWDANLDSENLQRINLEIDELSKNRIVIETRHRK